MLSLLVVNVGAVAGQEPADISVTKQCPEEATFGETLVCTITVRNESSGVGSVAQNVVINDTVVGGLIESAFATFATCLPPGPTPTIVCTLTGPLAPNDQVPIGVVIRAVAPGEVCDSASVASSTPDPNLTNNVTQACTDVGLPPLTAKEQCKEGGFLIFGFKNQGDCVSFLATGGKNEPGKNRP